MPTLCHTLALGLALAVPAPSATAPSPSAVAQAFYAYHFAHDMAFTPEGVTARSAWLAPDLLALCRSYFARPSRPDEVPEIDGDPFTDSQEYPGSFNLGKAVVSENTARVKVSFSGPGKTRRSLQVILARVDGSWLISDVEYGEGRSFRKLLATNPER